ncbi:hypothetical protein [Limosilactobacillus reuteri]|uniref:hypothetical protein n=1 Tax=Limosilactobacillus reuteri TaxID=1598 RepID=UPI00080C954D|nr:hypothetical protein [Limosilactobacillus reuteri]ANU51343.1 hypothetical protein A4V07_03215 [Limosilactobacillus reuteri]OXE59176.1 hypothetical protein ADH69_00690 [Limosilactobacillus reuteri]
MQFDTKTVNKLLEIDESYKAPERMLRLMLDDQKRPEVFKKFLEVSTDLKFDWFHEYFEDEQAERKSKKQDFTPDSIATLLNSLVDSDQSNSHYFEKNDDRNIILKVVSNLRDESIHQQTDDGVSQSVQINSGVASVDEVKVPNPVKLIPFRTFQEVDQPASKFIFRMREGMQSALFMADNNQWQVEAKNNIKRYIQQLEQETFGEIKYPVIA